MNQHIQTRYGTDLDVKNYFWKEVKAFKSAKLEEIIETKSELVNVADPTATKATAENYTEQLKELKTAIKSVKDASIRVLGNVNERTKELDKNKIC